ncbi:MAG: hypothetical protein PHC51_03730 [bacterium]|nr:hypothetical protein [bacterium]
MTTQPIIESDMTFGPYPDGYCFRVEKSNCYAAIKDHVQMAEFLLLQVSNGKSVIWIVEAKSSTPHPKTQPNFDDFIAEIREKLVNAFSLGWAAILRRHPQAASELPDEFKKLDLSQADAKFVLVINGHKDAWLPPLHDALLKALRSTIKTWGLSPVSVAVINDSLATTYGLIDSAQET